MKYYKFFAKYIPNLNPDLEQQKVNCPFSDHNDEVDSFSINLEKGLFQCFGCGKKGDIYSFYMLWHKATFKEAKRAILGDARVSILSDAEVDEAHMNLLKRKTLIDTIANHRGWTLDTIIRFRLGWNEAEKRIQIPVYNENDELMNIRKYDMFAHNPGRKFIGIRGHNSPYFFPIKNLVRQDVDFIFLCAGEPDTILACQFLMIAGTFTGGEGSFNRNLLPLFKDKKVYMCYDKDLAGMRGRQVVGAELRKYAKEVRIVDLPFEVGG